MNSVLKTLALFRNAFRFLYSYSHPETPLATTKSEIIQKIHNIRFNPHNPYLITGGHFSDLFVRNMGIFYNALLDPRIPCSPADWENRQQICYRTIKVALEVFTKSGHDSTTISHLWGNHYTTSNVYARASDSLYAILYGLKMLTDPNTIPSRYPTVQHFNNLTIQAQPNPFNKQQFNHSANTHRLTVEPSNLLLQTYRSSLSHLVTNYLSDILDPQTQLVRADLHLSSARDGIKRQSSFYDNVIAWSTASLANQLNIPLPITFPPVISSPARDPLTIKQYFDIWKTQIISTYWQPATGIFKDDTHTLTFSADQIIVLTTQFLDIHAPADRQKLHAIISYIQTHQLDQPFPLQYSESHQPDKLHWPVRYFAPHYMTHSIWSHWGIEYIKLLILLSPDNPEYLEHAKKHLASYHQNIETYGGYPECYNLQGKPLHEGVYHTVLHTSWVINYEQAQMLYNQAISS